MQKKLIAAAVAAAVTVPFAAAQADVKIYGKMDISYNFIDEDISGLTGNTDDSTMHISSNSSRLGFKGSEDLGAGLKAIWQIESAITVDGGASGLNQRNTYIGLAGDWGQVRMGRHDTPFKIVGRKADLFESEQLGENRAMVARRGFWAAGGDPRQAGGWDKRAAQTIAYISPSFNGFQVLGAYVPEEGTEDADIWSLAALYENGPLMIGAAYELEGESIGGTVDPTAVNNLLGTSFVTGDEEASAWRLVGSYTFGDFKVVGMFQDVSDDLGIDGNDWDVWGIGGQYNFGNNAIKAAYYDRSEFDIWDDTGAEMFSIGFDHNFSKRTKLYVTYAQLDNEDGQNFSLNSQGFDNGSGSSSSANADAFPAAGVFGSDPSGFAVGVRHKF